MMLGLLALTIRQMVGPFLRREMEVEEQFSGETAEFTSGVLTWRMPGGH